MLILLINYRYQFCYIFKYKNRIRIHTLISKMTDLKKKLTQFIITKIKKVQKDSDMASDNMIKLKCAISQVSYAHILAQYMDNSQYLFTALYHLSEAYLLNESYGQAIIQARLSKKQALRIENGEQDKTILLIGECMSKQQKYLDAYEIISQICIQNKEVGFKQHYFELLLGILGKLKEEVKVNETLNELEKIVEVRFGKNSTEYGFFLVEKGKSIGNFGKWKEAVTLINQGIEILIELRCKQKKKIMEIYVILAQYYKKQSNLDKQYSSLICAQSMAKQLSQPQTQIVSIGHLIAQTLIQKQQYNKALKQLKQIKQIQKQIYGESSLQVAKTIKKIMEILHHQNLKNQIKKYEEEYSRIVGLSGVVLKERTKNN